MLVELRSGKFSFEHAGVGLIGRNWENEGLPGGHIPKVLQLEHNRIVDAPIHRPGQFLLILGDLSVVRKSDERTFSVSAFFEVVSVNEHDIANGTAIVSLEPEGLYQIYLFDPAEHRPLAHRWLSFALISSDFVYNTRFHSDDAGKITFLGKPTLFRIGMERDVGVTIIPV